MNADAAYRTPDARTTPAVAGVVIAGGRSVRFGGEKAVALLAGQPLMGWAAQRLLRTCTQIAANVRPGTAAERFASEAHWAILHDLPGDAQGPLSGIRAGLQWALSLGATLLAVSPCDAPLLPADLYSRLLLDGGGRTAMAETVDGPQPLCSIWSVAALPRVTEALADGAHPSLWRFLDGLGAVRVRFDAASAFANLNTRDDLAALAARFAAP